MQLDGMNHFTILARDMEATRRFYIDVLGLKEGYRPTLGFDGAWFYIGDAAMLHVIGRGEIPDPKGGVFDHMAWSATDMNKTLRELRDHGVKYTVSQQTGSRVWQVFFHDPNGAKIELDFDPEETLEPELA